MKIPSWAQNYISKPGLQHVEQAIIDAEKKTSGEIRAVFVKNSSTTDHIRPMVTYLIWAVLFFIEFPHRLEETLSSYMTLDFFELQWLDFDPLYFTGVLLTLILGFSFARSLLCISQLQTLLFRWGISHQDQDSQVMMRAQNEFYNLNIQGTKDATGILLFVSLLEKKAVVLADKSISQHHTPDTWQEVINSMISGIKKKDIAEGFAIGIEQCGNILAQNFPIQPDDINELENHLIIKE